MNVLRMSARHADGLSSEVCYIPQEVSVDDTYESWLSTYSEPVHSNKGGLVAEKVRQYLCPMERGDRVVLKQNGEPLTELRVRDRLRTVLPTTRTRFASVLLKGPWNLSTARSCQTEHQ